METTLLRARFPAVAFLLLLLLPLVGNILGIGRAQESLEKRYFAPMPAIPHSFGDTLLLPKHIDDYLRDHFGMRRFMLFLPKLRYYMGGPRQVGGIAIGKDRWLFTLADGALGKHQGLTCLSEERKTYWIHRAKAAEQLARSYGGHLVFVIAPDKQSLYPEYLPDWIAQKQGTCDTYQYMLTELHAANINTVDARTAMLDAKRAEPVFFKNDTHWNDAGAFAVYLALRPVFGLTGATPVMRRQAGVGYGDISHGLNLADLPEPTVNFVGYLPKNYGTPPALKGVFSPPGIRLPSHVLPGAGATGRVLLVGDSYSIAWRNFFLQEAAEVGWTDRRWEDEQSAIKLLHPDWVVMEVAERLL